MMIRKNIIDNFPVMVEYIEIEEKIFITDVYILKVRIMRKMPKRLWVILLQYQDNVLIVFRS